MHPGSANGHRLLRALSDAIASYDPQTGEHCTRVGGYAVRIGELLDLEAPALDALRWVGELHDLGKLAVPANILAKPGRLNPDEWTVIRRHPIVGYEILSAISPDLEAVARGVRGHHERFDGFGYPDGLKGEAIPLLARIVCAADVFDSLTHRRPYREKTFAVWEALAFLRSHRDKNFDPLIVDTLFTMKSLVAT